MTSPWPSQELDLLLSCYLDGELDLATGLELEAWLRTNPEGRRRLQTLQGMAAALGDLRVQAQAPAGWMVRAYRIGLPGDLPVARKVMYLGMGLARPRALGHVWGGAGGSAAGKTGSRGSPGSVRNTPRAQETSPAMQVAVD